MLFIDSDHSVVQFAPLGCQQLSNSLAWGSRWQPNFGRHSLPYRSSLITSLAVCCNTILYAHDVAIKEVEIVDRRSEIIGQTVSASQGIFGQQELRLRPLARTGEILETVPGMVVTQQSGSGKTNQYFLRGFNLDHGTDFMTRFDGMPLNMRSHGHG
jgi:outer membrane receptor protein involved in Fe transport